MGRHYMKIGGEFRQQRVLAQRPRPMGLRFARDETANDGIDEDTKNFGAAYASFLLGVPTYSSSSRIESKAMNLPRTEFFGFFFQDDVKVNQRVTLNLGLRWEYETALKDPQRRLSRDLDLTNPIPELQGVALPAEVMAIRGSAPNYVGAWNFTSDDQPGAWNVPKNLFLPRAGVAIRINDRTALRIGYARYAVPPIQDKDGDINILGSTPYQGFEASSRTLGPLEGSPRVRLNDPFPTSGVNQNPLVPVTGKSSGRYTNLGGGGFWFRNDYKIGVNERINISLQRQVWNRFVVDLTWFMNFGYNHALVLDGNELLPNLIDPRFGFENGATVNQKVSNPFFELLPEEQMPGPLRNQKTVSLNSLLSPFPHYGKLEQSPLSEASNRYSALQLQVQRPFANGFNLLLGYNYNRARDQSYFDNQDRFDQNLSWFDSYSNRHRLTIGTIYELPFGRGRKFGTDMNKVADHIVGGWSVSGIFVYRGGRLLRFSG
ncbi:MAG: TonB-dependent receptor, partial [bacterium]|nr:TonB-dependent receptor [bacterium]